MRVNSFCKSMILMKSLEKEFIKYIFINNIFVLTIEFYQQYDALITIHGTGLL